MRPHRSLSRKEQLQQLMREYDLGMLVFWRPDELVLLLGYMPLWGLSFLACTQGGHVLYVPQAEPVDILPADVEVETFPWGRIDRGDPWEVLYGKLRERADREGLGGKRISFIRSIGGTAPCRMPGEQPLLPGDLVERLAGVCGGGWLDTGRDLLKLYQYKNEQDIAGIRKAHIAAKAAVGRFYELARPGITEAALAAALESVVQGLSGTGGIQFARAWPMVQSGINSASGGRYNRSSGRLLQASELVLLEMGVCVDGYWADISRTVAVGRITQRQEQVFHTVIEAQQRAFDLVRPGVRMAEVDGAARRHIEAAGWGPLFNHALGHHTGFRYHDPGETLSPSSEGVLEEGMILTVEPGIYGEALGGGMRIEDNILVTAGGYILLSDYSKGLS